MIKIKAYTLIEILIVLLIISIISGVALLSVSYSSLKAVRYFQDELAEKLRFAAETAILEPASIYAQFNPDIIQFYRYTDNKWQVISSNKNLKSIALAKDIALKIEILEQGQAEVEENENKAKRIFFSINGEVTPFKLFIGKKGEKALYIITNVDGPITAKALT